MLIEMARYPEAAALLEQNVQHVLPGVSTIHLYVHVRPPAAADRATSRPPVAISSSPARRRATWTTPSSPSTCTWSAPRSRSGAAIPRPPSRSPGKAWTGWSRWTTRSCSASWRCPRCTPPRTSPSEPERRAIRPRAEAAVGDARAVIDRYRAATERLPESGRAGRPASSAGGWRSARPSSPGRPARTIRRRGRRSAPRSRHGRRRSSRRTSRGARPRRGPGGAT